MTDKLNPANRTRGCSYCRCFKPFEQVRVVRTRFGVPRAICDACQKGRRNGKGNPK